MLKLESFTLKTEEIICQIKIIRSVMSILNAIFLFFSLVSGAVLSPHTYIHTYLTYIQIDTIHTYIHPCKFRLL